MADTRIEWASKVWNPVVGCSLASPGCTNCYAMRMAWRLQNMASRPDGAGNFHLDHYEGTVQQSNGGPVWTGKVNVAPDDVLLAPLRRKKPTDYFVNSMSDLFHPAVPFEVVDRVFAVMAGSPQHIFKVLTKRSARMREYLCTLPDRVFSEFGGWESFGDHHLDGIIHSTAKAWPLPNVWLGVSVEDQRRADERIPDLLATPAAVRFIRAEPLLGPVQLGRNEPDDLHDWLTGHWCEVDLAPDGGGMAQGKSAHIDWVIVGGESGPGARPMHPDWALSLRDQCADAGVPFLFKQWGTWVTEGQSPKDIVLPGTSTCFWGMKQPSAYRVGKKAAGRLLDGVEHNGMPEAAHG